MSYGLRNAQDLSCAAGWKDRETGSVGDKEQLTLHMELGPPAITLNEDGGAQEGSTTQRPNERTEHE